MTLETAFAVSYCLSHLFKRLYDLFIVLPLVRERTTAAVLHAALQHPECAAAVFTQRIQRTIAE